MSASEMIQHHPPVARLHVQFHYHRSINFAPVGEQQIPPQRHAGTEVTK